MASRRSTTRSSRLLTGVLFAIVLLASGSPGSAQENDDCLMCHSDEELTGTRGGREFSVFIDPAGYEASVHADFSCIDCHMDLDGAELPHDEDLEPVDCAVVVHVEPEQELRPIGAVAQERLLVVGQIVGVDLVGRRSRGVHHGGPGRGSGALLGSADERDPRAAPGVP